MIAEAIDRLLEIATGDLVTDNTTGRVYSTKELEPLPSREPEPQALSFHTLEGLVGYVDSELDKEAPAVCAVHVVDHETVTAISSIHGDFRQRFTLAVAKPFLPEMRFRYGTFQPLDEFIISLQACFVQDEAAKQILQIVGNIVTDEEITVQDDGFSQQVVGRAGIAARQHLAVPNPVTLRPYRTFPELEQPASDFVVRLKKQNGAPVAAMFPAGDAGWRRLASERICTWLAENGASHIPILG